MVQCGRAAVGKYGFLPPRARHAACFPADGLVWKPAALRSEDAARERIPGDPMTPNDYFRALLEVATVVNSSLEPAVVLRKITEQTARAMNCKASTIRLLNRTGDILLASADYGLSEGYLRTGPVEVGKSGLDADVLAGRLIHLRDATSDGRFQYPENARAEGLVSVLSSPLVANSKAIGILRVYSAVERDFSDDECSFMQGVANISAVAIANARMHEALRKNYELLTSYNYQVFED